MLETLSYSPILFFFFFNDTATTEIYTLSLHDALPISIGREGNHEPFGGRPHYEIALRSRHQRSEEHTSELQSQSNLVCRLLLEKKKKTKIPATHRTKNTKHRQRHHAHSLTTTHPTHSN